MFRKIFISLIPTLVLSSCVLPNKPVKVDQFSYGVFLGLEEDGLDKIIESKYSTVVIDAQNFSSESVQKIKDNNQTIYSYLNIGSIENFRPYYDQFQDLIIGEYQHWEEERWIDVSAPRWQNFVLNDLSVSILNKGVDGLFIDNTDVFYEFDENISYFHGLNNMLTELKKRTYICINGGDIFVNRYLNQYGSLDPILDGVNQETVFSKINWEDNTFGENTREEVNYYKEYVETVAKTKKDVYLLEYTTDDNLKEKIASYCQEKGFKYYISESLELI